MHFLLHFFGLDSASGTAYLAWSGALSDLGELALLGALVGLLRRHNCAVHRCWRVGRRLVEGTPFAACRRHHPSPKPTHAHIIALHQQHAARVAAELDDRERDET